MSRTGEVRLRLSASTSHVDAADPTRRGCPAGGRGVRELTDAQTTATPVGSASRTRDAARNLDARAAPERGFDPRSGDRAEGGVAVLNDRDDVVWSIEASGRGSPRERQQPHSPTYRGPWTRDNWRRREPSSTGRRPQKFLAAVGTVGVQPPDGGDPRGVADARGGAVHSTSCDPASVDRHRRTCSGSAVTEHSTSRR